MTVARSGVTAEMEEVWAEREAMGASKAERASRRS